MPHTSLNSPAYRKTIARDIKTAAQWIIDANEIFIGTGAGMGVDSGLPDFRSQDGFWKAYPGLGQTQTSFSDIAKPSVFETNPRRAWAFYGHRLNLYRDAIPHAGFDLLKKWVAPKRDYMIFTSNVDGQFQKAGFPDSKIVECHGSIHRLQCVTPCTKEVWSARDLHLVVDVDSVTLNSPIPRCPNCGGNARPNICMFNDERWILDYTLEQEELMADFISSSRNFVSIEVGAGVVFSSVRYQMSSHRSKLIRINPVDYGIENHYGLAVGLPFGGLEGLRLIEKAMEDINTE